jgi:hypothetical protein
MQVSKEGKTSEDAITAWLDKPVLSFHPDGSTQQEVSKGLNSVAPTGGGIPASSMEPTLLCRLTVIEAPKVGARHRNWPVGPPYHRSGHN